MTLPPLALASVAAGMVLAACEDRAPVNVVLIVIDTLRADAVLDPTGRWDTPNLDRLAREGVLFPRAFSAAPMTLPAHMSLFSSRPVHETGILCNGQDVPGELPLLAEWLAGHGYDTRAVLSLATLGVLHPTRSPARGFASYDSDYEGLSMAEQSFERMRVSLARRDPLKPLFLFAHFADPHEPYESHGARVSEVQVSMSGAPLVRLQAADFEQWRGTVELGPGRTEFGFAPGAAGMLFVVRQFDCLEGGQRLAEHWPLGQKWQNLSEARVAVDRGDAPRATCELRLWVNEAPTHAESRLRYGREVAYVDRYVGELRSELERLGLYRDSLILFTSDHGEGLGEHDVFGHVENLSDGLIQVPLIVKLPAGDPRTDALRAAASGMVSHLDLVPTLLAVAGLPPLPGQRGRPLFEAGDVVHVAQTSRPEAKVNQIALRDGRFKMVFFPDQDRYELYDLAADPGELRDAFAARRSERPDWPQRLRELHASSRKSADEVDPAERERRDAMLQALGYGGGD